MNFVKRIVFDFGKRARQRSEVITPLWPSGGLPDVKMIAVIHAALMVIPPRNYKKITAQNAVIAAPILRFPGHPEPHRGGAHRGAPRSPLRKERPAHSGSCSTGTGLANR